MLLAVGVGGAVGACCRYGLAVALPSPVSTLVTNVAGCLFIGVLMAVITESGSPHRLLRPFVGVGVLGGFTTYSTYILDLYRTPSVLPVVLYGVGTIVAALAAVAVGLVLTRAFLRPRGDGTS